MGYIRSNGVRSQALLSHFVLQCFNISLCLCHANLTGRRRGRRPGARIILDEGESEGIFVRATRIKTRLRFSDWSGCSDLGPAVRPKVRTRARFKPRSTSPSIRLNIVIMKKNPSIRCPFKLNFSHFSRTQSFRNKKKQVATSLT